MRTLVLLIAVLAAACGSGGGGDDTGDDTGDDGDDGDDGPGTPDAGGGGGPDAPPMPVTPSTDPSNPTPITVGEAIKAFIADGSEHFFVFTAPAAGTYTATLTGPDTALINHCEATGGCVCVLGNPSSCCQVDTDGGTCSFEVVDIATNMPLAQGQVIYPHLFTYPGRSGNYTLRFDGPN